MAKKQEDLHPLMFVVRVLQIFVRPMDWRLATVLCATFLGYTALLPAQERSTKALEAIEKLGNVLGSSVLGWLGWACLIVLLAAGVPYVVYAQRRINSLGEFQRQQRNKDDPQRLSSRDRTLNHDYVRVGSRAAPAVDSDVAAAERGASEGLEAEVPGDEDSGRSGG